LEEERRLAYVGLTRARRRAVISYAAMRRIYANWQASIPSRFIDELPDAHVARAGSATLEREARLAAHGSDFPWRDRNGARGNQAGATFPSFGRRPRVIEVWEQPRRPARTEAIPVGSRVFHQKFGYGTITAVEDNKLAIHFDVAGDKKIMDAFVEHASARE